MKKPFKNKKTTSFFISFGLVLAFVLGIWIGHSPKVSSIWDYTALGLFRAVSPFIIAGFVGFYFAERNDKKTQRREVFYQLLTLLKSEINEAIYCSQNYRKSKETLDRDRMIQRVQSFKQLGHMVTKNAPSFITNHFSEAFEKDYMDLREVLLSAPFVLIQTEYPLDWDDSIRKHHSELNRRILAYQLEIYS